MPGDMTRLTNLGQTLSRVGDQHVALDGDQKIASGSSNWLGRAVNWIKSALGLGNVSRDSRAIANHVVSTIRDTTGMGDRFADIAKGRLSSAIDRGQPITGREVSQVISDLVRTKTSESEARLEGVKLNAKAMCEHLCGDDDDSPMMTALKEQMELYGLGDELEGVEYADVLELQQKISSEMEKSSLRRGESPTETQGMAVVTEACRTFSMNRVHAAINAKLEALGDHSGEESPLMLALKARAEQRGIELDVQPGDLGKLKSKFHDKLIVTCLYDATNMHPPSTTEATTARGKIIDNFLDALAVVDADTSLTDTEQAAVKKAITSSPTVFTGAMAKALCAGAKAASEFIGVLNNPQSTPTQISDALVAYQEALDDAVFQENSSAGQLLRDGIGGAPEAEAVRMAAVKAGLDLAGVTKESASTALDMLKKPDSGLTLLRFSLEGQDQSNRSVSMKQMTCIKFLSALGDRAGLSRGAIDKMVAGVGPGGVSFAQLRSTLGEGVHVTEGVTVGQGFDKGAALHSLTDNMTEYMDKPKETDPMEYKSQGGFKPSFLGKVSHFSSGFLTDFFRNGITVDGERIDAPGTHDREAMEKALDKLIAKFPSAEEAGRVTKPLFQHLGAGIMIALSSDEATMESMGRFTMSTGNKLSDHFQFSITSKGGGSYGVSVELGIQRDKFRDDGQRADPMSLSAKVDMTISGANQGQTSPTVAVTDFDYVLGRMSVPDNWV